MGPVIPIIKAIGAVVVAFAKTKIGSALLYAAASTVVSRLVAKRALRNAASGGDGGGRVQLAPAADNKLPIVYGSAFVSGVVTDAKISTDNKFMWYVISLAEVSDDQGGGAGTYTFDTSNVYYGGRKVNFGVNGAVDSLTTNTTPAQTDTRIRNKVYIWLFDNGANVAGINTGGQTAIDIMSDSVTGGGIPTTYRWNDPGSIYQQGGQNPVMTNTAFAIIRVEYNVDAGTAGLDSFQVKITNSITKPGDAIRDYLINNRYGCNIPVSKIDLTSLTDLNTYSDATITYTPVGGGSLTQPRYRVDGPLDTANDCLTNLQLLVDSCDSWLQYSELTGQWRVVMNKPYTGSPFVVNSDNLVGGIDINPIDLNETYNEIEVAYPNNNVKDQTDYQIVTLLDPTTAWYDPTLLSPNEAVNRLNISLPIVNNAVQAKYLAVRRLLQSREDLTISFNLDYSGIQIDAGDVISVTHEVYGWTNKLFRVSSVAEQTTQDGSLTVGIVAFEYNATIYNDNAIQDYVPAFNTGLNNPNVISEPGVPTIATNPYQDGQIQSFKVTSAVPEKGVVIYMDFNYGNNSNVDTHVLYRSVQLSPGVPFTNSTDIANNVVDNVFIDVNDLPAGNYYFSTTARNDFAGRTSNVSNVYSWTGANITEPTNDYICNVSSNGTTFTHNASNNVIVGSVVTIISGNGTLNNSGLTYVEQIISNTSFVSSLAPTVDLSNACIQLQAGGIVPGIIQQDSVNWIEINRDANPQFTSVAGFAVPPVYANGVAFGFGNIKANTYDPNNWRAFFLNENSVYDANYKYPWQQIGSNTANGYLANSTGVFTPGNAAIIVNPPTSDRWYEAVRVEFAGIGNAINWYGNLRISTQWTATQDTMIQILPYYKTDNDANVYANTFTMSTVTIPANMPVSFQYDFVLPRIANITFNDGTYVDRIGWYVRNLSNSQAQCVYNYNEYIFGKTFNIFWPSITT